MNSIERVFKVKVMIRKFQSMLFFGIIFATGLGSNVVAQKSKPIAAPVTKQVAMPVSIYHLSGEGIADPVNKTGFFPNTSGGIDALNLTTGKLLWSSKEANRPLVTTQKHLFALKANGNNLQVVKINTKGQRLFKSSPIPLPDWASVETAYGRSFLTSVRLERNSLFLAWEARAFYSGGVQPLPEMVENAKKDQTGVQRIDINTGTIESLNPKKIAEGKFFPIAPVATIVNPKFGSLTLQLKYGSGNTSMNSGPRRRTLQGVNKANQVIWQRDIAPLIVLPLLP